LEAPASLLVPGSHALQTAASDAAKRPGVHATGHGVPSKPHACPGQHASHDVAFSPEKYLAAHITGFLVASPGHVDPLGQFRHAATPPGAYDPLAHASRVLPSGHAKPIGHGLGSMVLVDSHADRGGHAVQFSCLPAHVHSAGVPSTSPTQFWKIGSSSAITHCSLNVTVPSASTSALGVHCADPISAKEQVAMSPAMKLAASLPKLQFAATCSCPSSLSPYLSWNMFGTNAELQAKGTLGSRHSAELPLA
jgi:hypothetical protein